jgi:hypothetical protein
MRRFSNAFRNAAVIGAMLSLGACSEYLARRDGISPYAGDAVMGNQVVQMVDPWPLAAADRNIAYDGTVMTRAVQRYHAGRVIQPMAGGTSSTYGDQQSQASAPPADPVGAPAPNQAASK